MNHEKEREEFNTILERKTGNNYDIYADLCPFMGIINDTHLTSPNNSAIIYQTVFGLKTIVNDTQKEDVATQNRFLAVLFDYAENSRPDIWKKIPGVGILAKGENENETFLLTSNVQKGIASFLFQRTLDDVILHNCYTNQNSNKLKEMQAISGNPNFETIAEGLDIADFYELIQENIPYNEIKTEQTKRVTLKKNDLSPSL